MAEALGVVGSVIAIVQISDQILSACYQYYNTAKDADSDIRNVISGVSSLKCIMEQLRILLKTYEKTARIPHSTFLDEAICLCEEALEKLGTKLGMEFGTNVRNKRVVVSFTKKLQWPWKKRDVDKILNVIETHQKTFITALSGDTLRSSLAIEDIVTEMSQSLQSTTAMQRRNKIIEWLKLCDPSTNHNSARDKREPATGLWFIESDYFVSWTNSRNSSLWLYGIPGAGKTILCSTIVEHVIALCGNSDHRYAYFYFDFNDPDKRTVEGMLRCMVNKLCLYYPTRLPTTVEELYKQCDEGNQRPGKEGLIKVLLSLLKSQNRTYLILDALDECIRSERDKLFDVIRQVVEMLSEDVHLLVTSRRERDIKESLDGLIDIKINLQGGGNDDDIKLHVKKSIANQKRWKSRPEIRQEIENVLVGKANGMYACSLCDLSNVYRFRWVELQLDALKKCLTIPLLKKTLGELPDDLDKTYDRILLSIPKHFFREAYCALQFLAVACRPLTINEVAEAIAVDCEAEKFDPEDRLPEADDIIEICSSLVTLSGYVKRSRDEV